VVVDDLDVIGVTVLPVKANTPLIVDANTVLPHASGPEFLQSVARGNAQILEAFSSVHEAQLPEHDSLQLVRETPNPFAAEKAFGIAIREAVNHR